MQKYSKKLELHKTKYFFYIAIAFVVILMISNTVNAKIFDFFGLSLPGAIFIFPLSFIFGDILTEVYGYQASRKIIWSGFFSICFMSVCYIIVQHLPPAKFWQHQNSYEVILGNTPRVVLASIIAFVSGEFCNSYVMSKMKISDSGKKLWKRTIGSTLVGEAVDTLLFISIAFAFVFPFKSLYQMAYSAYFVKVAVEVIFTPVTYFVINKLKNLEDLDVYDEQISYNPFHLT